MTETVYVVFEQQLSAHESSPEVVWQNISIYEDRSDAYEYAATVDYRFDVNVMEKTIISENDDSDEDDITNPRYGCRSGNYSEFSPDYKSEDEEDKATGRIRKPSRGSFILNLIRKFRNH